PSPLMYCILYVFSSLLFHDPPPTAIYTLSLHDALPIWAVRHRLPARYRQALPGQQDDRQGGGVPAPELGAGDQLHRVQLPGPPGDRKSTRLNSSHVKISYAVFCLKKKKEYIVRTPTRTA